MVSINIRHFFSLTPYFVLFFILNITSSGSKLFSRVTEFELWFKLVSRQHVILLDLSWRWSLCCSVSSIYSMVFFCSEI